MLVLWPGSELGGNPMQSPTSSNSAVRAVATAYKVASAPDVGTQAFAGFCLVMELMQRSFSERPA